MVPWTATPSPGGVSNPQTLGSRRFCQVIRSLPLCPKVGYRKRPAAAWPELESVMDDRPFREVVEMRGHIIDSMTLPAIMDEIIDRGGEFAVQTLEVGRHKE